MGNITCRSREGIPLSSLLARIGRFTYVHRRATLVVWLLILVGMSVLSTSVSKPESNQFTIPGTQSQQAMDLLEATFPQATGASAQMVFEAPIGSTLTEPTVKAAVEASLAKARLGPQVVLVTDPYVGPGISKSGQIAYATVAFKVPAAQISDASKQDLAAAAKPARSAGITVAFGGGIVTQPTAKSSDALGLAIAYLVLAITFGSLLAAGLPLITAVIGVTIGLTTINALSAVVSLSSTAPILATMIGLAVAIDYALFIVHRYREELGRGLTREEAVSRATGTAGVAVAFAGSTVIIALVGLTVVGIPFLSVMGLAAAGTVAVAVVIALTLIPALLGFAGRRVSAPKAKRRPSRRGLIGFWSDLVTGRPVIVLLVGIFGLLALASPLLDLRLGLPSAGTQPKTSTSRTAYDLLAHGFGPGVNGPLLVVVDAPQRYNTVAVAEVATKGLRELPGVASVGTPAQNSTKTVTVVVVTPASGPSSVATSDLVATIRTRAAAVTKSTGVRVLVTGPTALNIDVSAKLGAALPPYLLVVVGLAFILLVLIFRSLLVPLKAVAGFLLSIGATLGAVVWIFQDGHLGNLVALPASSPVISFLPILLIGILFGLAMDYEMFLVSRMREMHVAGSEPRSAVTGGFRESGPVVTAAAIIMFSVFASFIVSDDLVTKEIGFSLAVGVVIDAFIVRMTLVPAAMTLMGRSAWWIPRWLDRVLPHVDLEGASLDKAQRGPVEHVS